MTVVVALLAVVVALLVLLVAGLLRSHAEIMRRLHDLGAGLEDLPAGAGARPDLPQVPSPPRVPTGRAAHDVTGATLDGGSRALRVTGVPGDTLLLFLSSGCLTCRPFWDAAAGRGPLAPPAGVRVAVIAKDLDEESPSALAELAGGTDVVLSSEAWRAYAVPGSPYAVLVDGPSGRIRGEGTGTSWDQVARMLAQATGDLAYVGEPTPRASKARSDAARERDTDAELLAAGIVPGDPSLYPSPAQPAVEDREAAQPPSGAA